MKNLKDNLKDIVNTQKKILKQYGFTLILTIIITLLVLFIGFESKDMAKVYISLILTDILFFVIESCIYKKNIKILLYILAFILAIITTKLIYTSHFTLKQALFIIGLYFIVLQIAIYKIVKDSEVMVSEYLSKIFNNHIIFSIAISSLQSGLLFIVFIIEELLLKNSEMDLYLKAEILLIGFFMIPGEILCLKNIKKEVLKPIQILICYIILPLITIAELIIYIYFIKILVIREIPSNIIFSIIACLFVFACPTWIMIDHFKKNNNYIKISSIFMPYSFIPFIGMQIYAVGIRIIEFGFTKDRYLGVMLILFEIIIIVLTLIKKQKYLNKVPFIIIMFILVIMCIPEINVVDVPWQNQLNRLTDIYQKETNFDQLSQKDKNQVVGAYRYLKYDEEGKKHIPNYIDKSKLNQYSLSMDKDSDVNDIYKKIEYYTDTDEIPVDGFKKAIRVEINKYLYDDDKNKLSEIDFDELSNHKKLVDSLKEIIDQSMDKDELINQDFVLDKNTSFWIESFYLEYKEDTKEIRYINISGYMLIK